MRTSSDRRASFRISSPALEAASVPFALAAVYLGWGSSSLALHVTLQHVPACALLSARYLLAGTILFVALRLAGRKAPTACEWRGAAKAASLFLVFGSTGTMFVGANVEASAVALAGTIVPLVATACAMVLARRATRSERFGLAIGAVGTFLLATRVVNGGLATALLLLVGPTCWGLGSVFTRRLSLPAGAMSTAAQLLCGGVAMALLSVARREQVDFATIPLRAALAFVHLTFVGSIVAFTAFGHLVRCSPPAVATSYAYVNPIVALVLAVHLGGEHLGAWELASAALLLTGVITVTASQLRETARSSMLAIERVTRSWLPPEPRD